ncbi:MAG: bifunctional hydroxymethylpyrimidine kinase/phosphomethylpyrimidine kinase [Chlorobiaceae bacterium]|nr:bifunctional hydroxymethylpyrimidine kinase/phosphomethylpyrimidine kinase [Chlorobiaceae bacterium]
MSASREYTTILTIAGSDGSGGAGIQADLKTIAAAGCYGLSVITAVTAQNTLGVTGSYLLPAGSIREQFKAIADDIRIDAVKIGMLGSKEAAETVAELLKTLEGVPVVLDTVLRSTGGEALFPADGAGSMGRLLFPAASLITPNLPETAMLAGLDRQPSSREEIEQAALRLNRQGARSVLVKGGHGTGGECRDCLLHEGGFFWFANPRIETVNTHGTGCTLSSAIASGLAGGKGMVEAVERGIAYTRAALQAGAGLRLGHGHGPLQHFPGIHQRRRS